MNRRKQEWNLFRNTALLAAICSIHFSSPSFALEVELQTLMNPFESVPGEAPGVTFLDPIDWAINASGHVVFVARVDGPGIPYGADSRVWIRDPETSTVEKLVGQAQISAALGIGPVRTWLSTVALNDAGNIILTGSASGGS